jgi:hypothetical protein
MTGFDSTGRRGSRVLAGAIVVGTILAILLSSGRARAHFILQAPACYSQQDTLGLPQKSAPCGQADTGSPVMTTGAVTHFQPGDTITVTIDEVIAHPGHYRVALAADQASLPADPVVTAGTMACGTAAVENSPTLPILADGLLDHTAAFSSPQSVQVKLPAGMTCTKCTLQIVEFMSDHGLNPQGGCFYHHCADISIGAGADDGGSSSTDAAGKDATTSGSSGTGGSSGVSGSSGTGAPSGASGSSGTRGASGASGSSGTGAAGGGSGSGGTGGQSGSVSQGGTDASSALPSETSGAGGGCAISVAHRAPAAATLASLAAVAVLFKRRRRR